MAVCPYLFSLLFLQAAFAIAKCKMKKRTKTGFRPKGEQGFAAQPLRSCCATVERACDFCHCTPNETIKNIPLSINDNKKKQIKKKKVPP